MKLYAAMVLAAIATVCGVVWLYKIKWKKSWKDTVINLTPILMFCVIAWIISANYNPFTETITVKALQTQNSNALSNEICIDGLYVGEKRIKLNVVGDEHWIWIENGDLYAWQNTEAYSYPEWASDEFIAKIPVGYDRSIKFVTNEYKGQVEVIYEGNTQFVDCYSEQGGILRIDIPDTYSINLLRIMKVVKVIIFAVILSVLSLVWIYVSKRYADVYNKITTQENSVIKAVASFFTILLAVISLYLVAISKTIQSPLTMTDITPSYYYGCLAFAVVGAIFAILIVKTIYSNNHKREFYLHIFVFAMFMCYICVRYPISTWQAEPGSEGFSNIIWQTYERGFVDALLLDDNGYWTLLPRIISIMVLKVFHILEYSSIIIHIIALLVISYVYSKIVSRSMSKYGAVELRMLVLYIVMAATWLISDGIRLTNMAYCGGLLIIICYLADLQKVSKPIFVLDCVISFLACCSKPQLCVFTPVFIIIIAIHRKSIEKRKLKYLLTVILGGISMTVYYLLGIGEGAISDGKIKIYWVEYLLSSIYEYLQVFVNIFIGHKPEGYFAGIFINLLIILVIVSLCVYLIKKKEYDVFLQCAALCAYAIGSYVILYAGWRNIILIDDVLKKFTIASGTYIARNHYIMVSSAIILLLVIFTRIKQSKNILSLAIVCFSFVLVKQAFQPQTIAGNTYTLSNYAKYAYAMDNDAYGIIGDGSWFILKNAEAYYYGNEQMTPIDGHYMLGVSKMTQVDDPFSSLELEEKENIVSVYTKKMYLAGTENISMNLYDENHELLQTVQAITESDRIALAFILDTPCNDVKYIELINQDTGKPYYVEPHFFVVVEDAGSGIDSYALWGRSSLEE